MTEKERIDYEIEAKRKARNREMAEWGCALWLGILLVLAFMAGVVVLDVIF